MMHIINKAGLVLFFLVPLCSNQINAQGCSDAGFCTVGNLGAQQTTNTAKHKLALQFPMGIGDENVLVFTPAIQYDHTINKKWAVQAKLTGNYANGNLGTAAGLGDLILSGTYLFSTKKNNWQTSATLGAKLPLSQSNIKENNLSLPMQYQSSLGTIDLITGLALSNIKWQFAAGYQQPLSGTNGNQFLPIYWNGHSDAAKYIPSNDFKRRADVLLRALYKQKIGNKFILNGGLLGIYHLGEDTYIDANISNKPLPIKGSSGLTLNATLGGWLSISPKLQIGFLAGVPLVVRTVRPDGLTRSFVFAPEISWNF